MGSGDKNERTKKMEGKKIEVHADVCIKSPILRKMHRDVVSNIVAGVAQVVAQEVCSLLEAMEQTVEEMRKPEPKPETKGGAE